MKKLFLIFSLLLFPLVGRADVLWWGVVDNSTDVPSGTTTVNGSSLRSFVESQGTWSEYIPEYDEIWTGYNLNARVVAIANGITYNLPVYSSDYPDDNFESLEFFEGGGQK